jgi:Fur family ferric uptake transcriptional regulator
MQIRERILKRLEGGKPISAPELLAALRRERTSLNKTTVYRALDGLTADGFLEVVEFGEGAKRYEIKAGHHHHLVCLSCGDVADVDLEDDLKLRERAIAKQTGFRVERHALEFFGRCAGCF